MARNKKIRNGMRKTPRKHGGRLLAKPKLFEHLETNRRKRRSSDFMKKIQQQQLLRNEIMKERQKRGKENSKKSPSKLILYPPVPPPPPPKRQGTSSPSTSSPSKQSKHPTPKRSKCTKPARLLSNTPIVIDSEDDSITEQSEPVPLFYVDTKAGFHDREIPKYTSIVEEPDEDTNDASVMLVGSILEEGEVRSEDESDILNVGIRNSEEIHISDDDEEKGAAAKTKPVRMPMPIRRDSEDQSVIFCSEEVIDVDKADRVTACDYIPIGFDDDFRRKRSKKRSPQKSRRPEPSSKAEENRTEQDSPISKRMVIIDGNNVAFGHTCGQHFSVKGLKICLDYIKKMGHEVKAVVPQFRLKKDKTTDQKLLEDMYKNGDILLAPSKNLPGQRSSSYDDRLIISVAEKFDGVIISNDNFRDLLAENDSWKKIIETRVIGYTWAMDAFFLPDDPYGRHGPKLKDLLERKDGDGSSKPNSKES